MGRARVTSGASTRPRPEAEEVVRTHRRILEEIEAGRAEEAERVAAAHLAATQALVLADVRGRRGRRRLRPPARRKGPRASRRL